MREGNLGRVLRPILLVEAVLNLKVIVVGALGASRISGKRGAVVELLDVLLVPRCAVDVDAVRRDLELAIHDDELDVREVAADVLKVVRHEAHVVLANEGALGNLVAGIAHEGEAAIGVEAVAGLVGVALNALLVAVVGLGVTVLGDGDGHLVRDRVDLEGAVLGRDGVVLGIGVGVQLVALEHVRTAAGVGLAARDDVAGDALAIYEALASPLVVLAGRSGGVDQGRAVIGLLIARSGERHGALIDLELACDRGHGKEAGDVIAVSVLDRHGRNLIGHAAGVGKRRIAGHGLDRVLHVVEGVLGLGNARDAVLGAVIGVLSGVARDGDGELRIRLGDSEGTLGLRDDIVAVLALGRAAGQRIAEGVRAPTDEQLAAGDAVVRALVPDEAVAGDGHGTVRKRRTVIGLRVVRRRQRDFALGDGKLAVSNDELNVGEVIALVLELAVLEAHRVRAGVGLLHLGGAGVGEVALLIESVVDGDRVARGGLLGAVVLGAGLVARDGHGHLVGHRGDVQGAGLGGDGVVDVVTLVVLLRTVASELVGELVVHAADVGDGAGSGGREAVALGEGAVGDGHVLISKGFTVVDLLTAARRQLDSALVDGQSAVNDDELNVGEVLADVLEVARLELHLIGASIGSAHGGGTAEGEVARGVQLVVARDVVARDGLLVAVIGQRVAVLGDGHGDLVGHGVNRQVALDLGDVVVAGLGVRAIKDDVEVVLRGTRIGLAAGVGIGDASLFALDEAAVGHAGLILGQRGAVIGLRVGTRGDGDVLRRNGELAGLGGHGELGAHVVALGVNDGPVAILVGAGDGLRVIASILAGDVRLVVLDLERLAVEFERIGLDAIHDLVRPVVGLGLDDALERDLVLGGAIRDGQRATLSRDAVVAQLGAVLGLPAAVLDRALRRANERLRALDGRRLDALALDEAVGLELASGQRLAVVLLLSRTGGNGRSLRVNGELAVDGSQNELVGNVIAGLVNDLYIPGNNDVVIRAGVSLRNASAVATDGENRTALLIGKGHARSTALLVARH